MGKGAVAFAFQKGVDYEVSKKYFEFYSFSLVKELGRTLIFEDFRKIILKQISIVNCIYESE